MRGSKSQVNIPVLFRNHSQAELQEQASEASAVKQAFKVLGLSRQQGYA